MKNTVVFAAFVLLLCTFAFARDFRPEARIETLSAADSSVQECYIFCTKAGVRYTVETSNDLTNWTSQEEIYGLGNEYVVTMREFCPPPPAPPGAPIPAPPDPVVNASIKMERASGPAGGTVIAWALCRIWCIDFIWRLVAASTRASTR
jgi:hypothetical protein